VRRSATVLILTLGALLLGACADAVASVTPEDPPVQLVRRLATVDLPPTLSVIQRQATRQAIPSTPTLAPPTVTPTGTPYVGVFLGEAQIDIDLPRQQPSTPSLDVTETTDACAIPFDPVFGTVWRENPSISRRVGCALQERFGFAADVQVFERGVMYRRQDTGEVWAIQPGQVRPGRFWYTNVALLPAPVNIAPPEGLRAPSELFLGLWSSDSTLQQALGYARTPQQTADLNVQRIEGGTLILDVTISQVFLLLDNGDSYGPY